MGPSDGDGGSIGNPGAVGPCVDGGVRSRGRHTESSTVADFFPFPATLRASRVVTEYPNHGPTAA